MKQARECLLQELLQLKLMKKLVQQYKHMVMVGVQELGVETCQVLKQLH